MHSFSEDGPREHRMEAAELHHVAQSEAMQTAIAENYVGLPLRERSAVAAVARCGEHDKAGA